MSLIDELKAWHNAKRIDREIYSESIACYESAWSMLEWDEKVGVVIARLIWGN